MLLYVQLNDMKNNLHIANLKRTKRRDKYISIYWP